MSEIETFIKSVEDFLAKHDWTATRFGREMVSDPRFVFQLREGREPRSAVRNRISEKMAAFEGSASPHSLGSQASYTRRTAQLSREA
jgi:homoserine dehydrogenase